MTSPLRLLTPDETRTLIAQAQTGEKEARDCLVLHNMRWVHKNIAPYQHIHEAADLLQEGALGLIEAVNHYDLKNKKQVAFSTYATFWIRQRLRAWHYQQNPLHVSRGNHEFALKIRKRFNDQEAITPEVFAQQESIRVDQAQMLFSFASMGLVVASLDTPILAKSQDDEELILADLLTNEEDVYENIPARLDSQTEVQPFLAALTKREYEIITRLYGIGKERELNVPEVATVLGVSHQAVSLGQKNAFVRMRAICQAGQSQEVSA